MAYFDTLVAFWNLQETGVGGGGMEAGSDMQACSAPRLPEGGKREAAHSALPLVLTSGCPELGGEEGQGQWVIFL